MSSDKDGKEKKLGGKVAGLAVAAGVFWGIFRFIKGRKEESLIREYYGDREDFHLPSDSEQKYDDDDDDDDKDDYKVLSHDDSDKEVEIDPAVEELKTDTKVCLFLGFCLSIQNYKPLTINLKTTKFVTFIERIVSFSKPQGIKILIFSTILFLSINIEP